MQDNHTDIKRFLSVIRKEKGIDLGSYRQTFLMRRLSHRMRLTDSENLLSYLRLLKEDDSEFDQFLDALSINVSEFFRDPEVFDYFKENCLKEIFERKNSSRNRIIRIWSAGCSEGQETYSLAILLKETLEEKNNFFVRIIGTDIDQGALKKAEEAEYQSKDLKEMNKPQIEKYFKTTPNGLFRVNQDIRTAVKFFQKDIFDQFSLKYLDVIFCRNLMIYFSRPQQEELILKFSRVLNAGGYLVIGKVEAIWRSSTDMFRPVSLANKIYQKNKG
ncbi:MAG: protein-glutamate O-methyltransferase CheR [Candidatus Omnitrophota bacterium]